MFIVTCFFCQLSNCMCCKHIFLNLKITQTIQIDFLHYSSLMSFLKDKFVSGEWHLKYMRPCSSFFCCFNVSLVTYLKFCFLYQRFIGKGPNCHRVTIKKLFECVTSVGFHLLQYSLKSSVGNIQYIQ